MTSRAAALRRGPEEPQRATFLELFFDLVFVFALFQLSHRLLAALAAAVVLAGVVIADAARAWRF